jgi:hypothetical protein
MALLQLIAGARARHDNGDAVAPVFVAQCFLPPCVAAMFQPSVTVCIAFAGAVDRGLNPIAERMGYRQLSSQLAAPKIQTLAVVSANTERQTHHLESSRTI